MYVVVNVRRLAVVCQRSLTHRKMSAFTDTLVLVPGLEPGLSWLSTMCLCQLD